MSALAGAIDADAEQLRVLGSRCRRAGATREVLLIRLSRIPMRDFRPHYARLAEGALERLGRAPCARLYRLPEHDLALSWRDGPGDDAGRIERTSTTALRTLFSAAAAPLPPLDELLRRFHLPGDAAALASLLRPSDPVPLSAPTAAVACTPLDVAELRLIERALDQADVSRFARRRVVVRRAGGTLERAFDRRFLSLAEVAAALARGRDLAADPWLLRRLTRTLDQRMLALLAAPHELNGPTAFPLSIASALSPAFLAFDGAIPRVVRGELLIALAPADVAADPTLFTFARDFLRTRGYRLILEAPDPAVLPALPIASLGLDFVALDFSTLMALSPRLLAAVLPEPQKIILRAPAPTEAAGADQPGDDAAMLAWGEAAGVALYELARATV